MTTYLTFAQMPTGWGRVAFAACFVVWAYLLLRAAHDWID
jgi:hypothetical protein